MKTEKTRAQRIRSASVQRRKQQKEDLRQMILEAALELFEEQGYEKFSLRQVAEAIGYTPTTIYLYFKNKDDLLFQTVADGFRAFGEALQAGYNKSTEPYTRFLEIGRAYIKFGLEHPVHYRLMFMQRGEFLYQTGKDCEPVIDSFGILKQALQDCVNAGLLEKNALDVYANTAWAFVHGIVSLAISVPHITPRDSKAVQKEFEAIMAKGFFKKGVV